MHPLVRSADFERVLGSPSKVRSAHFAVHHLVGMPLPRCADAPAIVRELSTEDAPSAGDIVDNLSTPALTGQWFGMVVPKRHARRAVSRTLIKRQMRCAIQRHAAVLPQGLWVLRLRHPFDRQAFPSAASDALRRAVSAELDTVLQRAAR